MITLWLLPYLAGFFTPVILILLVVGTVGRGMFGALFSSAKKTYGAPGKKQPAKKK